MSETVTSSSNSNLSLNCISLNVGGSLNALSLSPDGTQVVVAGREVLKIVSIQDDQFKEVQNLRVGKLNLNYSSVDAKWHPQEQHKSMIATAATNGAVVIWNINKEGQKQERVINEHTRTVNRITWHPDHAYTLLSASQDGTMKLWDIRDPTNCKVTFDGKAEAVRDVQFSKFPNYFAAAFDNGTIQIWDIRKHSAYERKIMGHQGPVFCIDWHPDDRNLFASGGRDRFIQVWDLNQTSLKPLYSIQTVSSVSHINWRPNNKYHIVSTGLMDSKMHIWDVKKPFIPCYSFVGHQDVVSDVQWSKTSPHKIYSCGKDCTIMQQNVKSAYRPYEHIRTVGLSWAPLSGLALVADKINRTSPEETPSSVVFPSFFAFGSNVTQATVTTATPSDDKHKRGLMYLYLLQDNSNSVMEEKHHTTGKQPFLFLANNYKYREPNLPFGDICDHNASVARTAKQYQVAQVWNMIKLFFGNASVPAADQQQPIGPPSNIHPPPPTAVHPNTAVEPQTEHKHISSPEPASLLPDLNTSLNIFDPLMTIEDEQPSGLAFPSTLVVNNDKSTFLDDSNFLSSDVSFPLEPLPAKTSVLEVPPLPKLDTVSASQQAISSEAPAFGESTREIRKLSAETSPYGIRFEPELHFDPRPFIVETLEFYAEQGDVQHAVIMAIVLEGRILLDNTRFRQWLLSYIELLHKLEQWTLANELIRKSKDKSVGVLNQTSTTLHTSCPECNKPLISVGWKCDTCKKPTNPCSVCHGRVRGLYSWCQTCSHGGCMDHMLRWFSEERFCPTGCGHQCIL